MGAVAGYATTLYGVDTGDASVATEEACTRVTANTVYQITSAAKRIWDPSAAVLVEVDADGAGAGGWATAAATTYTINWLFGTITFASDQGASALVRVSATYWPRTPLSECTSISVDCMRAILDTTVFSTDGAPGKLAGLKSASGTLEVLTSKGVTIPNGAETWRDMLEDFDRYVIEVQFGGTGDALRAFAVVSKITDKATPGGLYGATINWETSASAPAGRGTDEACWAFGALT